ncbi:hemagglutinin/amebocyte aggregation factor [Patella vulgata]|uniref:hemagglutinin/amebocyte aggregation factor n=1 Tax=Patella vulgata TaxID=6465 RepID=UPI00217F24EC|nr:hemagglutinin/amebocyte aggregation factor [Patella vulgata]
MPLLTITMILKVVSLFACLIMVSMAWQNDYDRNLEFVCPTGQSISRIQSKHHNHYEDRVWQFSCSNKGRLGHCKWFYNVNEYDGVLFFQCPNFGHIVATRSHHDNHREDRRFSFKCCAPKNG